MTVVWGDTRNMPPSPARVFLYGPARSGKTVAAASFPKPFWIWPANENSITSVRNIPMRHACIGTDPTTIRADMNTVLDAMVASDRGGRLQLDFGETIVVDAFSHYVSMVITEIEGGENGKGKKMTDSMWGLLLAHLTHVRDMLFGLSSNVVVIALADLKADKQTGVYGPLIQGQAGELVPSSFDILAYCEELASRQYGVHVERHTTTQNGVTVQFVGGTRLPGMPPGLYPNHQLWPAIAPHLGHR